METPLAKGIKFRSLMDQLSKQEFLQFINKMFDENAIHLMTNSLFKYFTQSSCSSSINNLNNINNILSNIIESRKSKPKQVSNTNIKLHQLPKPLIGHTASFLDPNCYLRFEKTNRSIFVGCNAPNMLRKLGLMNVKDYSSINLAKFRSLQHIEINISQFHQFTLPNHGHFILNELEGLTLNAQKKHKCNIELFMNQNAINIRNIKILKFYSFGDRAHKFNKDTFLRLLLKFPCIEYLSLLNIYLSDSIHAQELSEKYPNLKGLSVRGGNKAIGDRLINAFGNGLYFLLHSKSTVDLSNINFNKLEQVELGSPKTNTIHDILKTARNLKKFRIRTYDKEKRTNSLSIQELQSVIPEILRCESLNHLELGANDDENCVAVLNGIEMGLYETKKFNRKRIKIKVFTTSNSCINVKKIIFNIGRIIHWLLESVNISDFMFILDLKKMDKKLIKQLEYIEILNELNEISSNIAVKGNGWRYIITNRKYNFNVYQDCWMMK